MEKITPDRSVPRGDGVSSQKTPKSGGEGDDKGYTRPNTPNRSVVWGGDGGRYAKLQYPSCAASKSGTNDPSVLKRSPRYSPAIVESELWGS